MGRPHHPPDLAPLSELCARYGVSNSTLRMWIKAKALRAYGRRPARVSETALVEFLESKGRPTTPRASIIDDDPELSLAEAAALLGVATQTASAYKSTGKLRSYRRSDVEAYRVARDSRATRQHTGLAEHRARRERALANRAERQDEREAGMLYPAAAVDQAAEELGRLLARQRQQGAQRVTAAILLTLSDHGIVPTDALRAALVDTVGQVLDAQGQALTRVLQTLADRKD